MLWKVLMAHAVLGDLLHQTSHEEVIHGGIVLANFLDRERVIAAELRRLMVAVRRARSRLLFLGFYFQRTRSRCRCCCSSIRAWRFMKRCRAFHVPFPETFHPPG